MPVPDNSKPTALSIASRTCSRRGLVTCVSIHWDWGRSSSFDVPLGSTITLGGFTDGRDSGTDGHGGKCQLSEDVGVTHIVERIGGE